MLPGHVQGDDSRAVFKFTPLIAPVKATVFPLLQKQQLNEQASLISKELTTVGLSNIIDTTGERCYARGGGYCKQWWKSQPECALPTRLAAKCQGRQIPTAGRMHICRWLGCQRCCLVGFVNCRYLHWQAVRAY